MGHKTAAADGGAKAADGKAKLKGNPTGGNKKPAPKAKPAGGNGTPPPPEAQPAGGDGTLKPKAVGGGDGGAAGKAEGQYAVAKTSVWWDIENCAVPRGSDPHAVARSISSGLVAVGYKGAVTITAYGDTSNIQPAVQQALSSTGISLNHVPAGVKKASDKRILVDMLFWAVDHPPPANYLLISGDRDFSNALHQLRLRRYNILLAHLPNVSQALVAAANCVWCWTNLLEGGPPLPKQSTHVKSSTFPIEKKVTNQSPPLPLNQTSPIAKKVLNKKPISLPPSQTFPCHKVQLPHGKVSILSRKKKMTTSKRKTKNSTGNLGILPLKKKVRRRKRNHSAISASECLFI